MSKADVRLLDMQGGKFGAEVGFGNT